MAQTRRCVGYRVLIQVTHSAFDYEVRGEKLMGQTTRPKKLERKSFARIKEVLEMPNLIEVQQDSYQWFLDVGIREMFQDISPIQDFTGNLVLEFIDYSLGEPKYSVEECKERDATFAASLRVKVRLINKETGEVKEQEEMCIRDREGDGAKIRSAD